jgi:hypothetical protein
MRYGVRLCCKRDYANEQGGGRAEARPYRSKFRAVPIWKTAMMASVRPMFLSAVSVWRYSGEVSCSQSISGAA